MRLTILGRTAFVCATMTFASACSSDPTGTEYDATVSTDIAENVADMGWGMLNSMMASISNMGIGLSPEAVREQALGVLPVAAPRVVGTGAWRTTFDPRQLLAAAMPVSGPRMTPPGCSVTESGVYEPGGDPVDANENGFPDDYRFRQECLYPEEGAGDTIYTTRLLVEVVLRELTGVLAGYELRVNISERMSDNYGNFEELIQRSEADLSVRSDRASQHNLQLVSQHSHLPGMTETAILEQGSRGDASFDPFGTIVLGDPFPDGELTLNGRIHAVSSEEAIAIQFTLDTPEPLEFDRTCADGEFAQPFIDGVLRGRLNGGNSIGFTVTYNGCGTEADVDIFGTEEEAPAARRFAPRPYQPLLP